MLYTASNTIDFQSIGFEVTRPDGNITFFPYNKVYFVEFFCRNEKYGVNVAFGNSPLEILEVTCKDKDDAMNFYAKFKLEFKFWQR